MGCIQFTSIDIEFVSIHVVYKFHPASFASDYPSDFPGNDKIKSQLKRDQLRAMNKIKMLLLGTGEL